MAENKQVILDIKTNAQEVAQLLANAKIEMQQLKDAQKNLDELYKSGLVSKAAYVQQTGALSEQLTHCKEATQAYTYELKNNIKQEREQEGSIKSLRAELNNLLRAYDGLSRTERENAKGKEMLSKINELTKEIKDVEYASQRFQRNVGNYPQLMAGVGGAVGGVGRSLQSLGATMKALLANPIVAIIAAIVAVLSKLWDAIKKNDDAMTAVQALFGQLKPILDLIGAAFAKLAEFVGKAATAAANFVNGITRNIPALAKFAKANDDIVKSTDKLEDAERKYTVEHAKRENKKADLLNRSRQSEKYTASERRKFLEEAMKLDEADLKAKVTITKEKLRLLKLEAQVNKDTSDETKNQISELEAQVLEAETNMKNGQRRTIAQLNTFDKELNEQRKQRAAAAEARRKEEQEKLRQHVEQMNEQIASAQKQLDDYAFNQIKDSAKKAKLQVEKELENTTSIMMAIIGDPKSTAEQRSQAQKIIDDATRNAHEQIDAINKATQDEALKKQIASANAAKTLELENNLRLATKGSKDELNIKLQQLNMQHEAEMQAAEDNVALREEINRKYTLLADEQVKTYDNQLKREISAKKAAEKQKMMLAVNGANGTLDAFSSLFSNLAKNDEKYLKYANAISYAKIMVDMARGIASAVAEGMKMGWPAAAVMIPAGIATVVGGIASALSVFNQNKNAGSAPRFSRGGLVTGEGTSTSDSIDAKLSNGEFVVNAKSTRDHIAELVAINGGWGNTGGKLPRFASGGYVDIASRENAQENAQNAIIADAIRNMPAPVVSVKEITNTQRKIQVKENISKR